MMRLVVALVIFLLPQFVHAAGKIAPTGRWAAPSGSAYSPQKPSYRYGHAPTPDSYNRSMWCGSPEVGAEGLVWRSCTGDFAYAIASANEIGTVVEPRPSYGWGFQLYAGYHLPIGWGGRVVYTRFKDRFSSSRAGGDLISIYGEELNSATTTIRSHYRRVDAELVSTLCCARFATLQAFGGARWLRLTVDEATTFDPTSDPLLAVHQAGTFSGTGPRFGIRSTLTPIPCSFLEGFEISGQIAASAPIGRRTSRFVATEPLFISSDRGLSFPGRTLVTLGLEMRVGVGYTLPWASYSWTLYIDYERQADFKSYQRIETITSLGLPITTQPFVTLSGINFGLRTKY